MLGCRYPRPGWCNRVRVRASPARIGIGQTRTNEGKAKGMFRVATVLLLAAALLTSTGAARADDPPYIGWSQRSPA